MPNLKIESNGYYKADDLYQWDKNQMLYIYGVNIRKPILHFNTKSMVFSIVRHPKIDDSGVITCMIPNSLLQKTEPISVYVCGYEGETFKTYYALELKVKARPKPADYMIEADDEEIYSFVALEQKVIDALADYDDKYYNSHNILESRVKNAEQSIQNKIVIVNEALTHVEDERIRLNAFKNDILDRTDYLINSVKPWNVDVNVGLITAETWSTKLRSNVASANGETGILTDLIAIPMINSGEIKLQIPYIFKRHGSTTRNGTENFIKVYLNDVAMYTIPYPSEFASSTSTYSYSEIETIPMIVNKGDTLKIEASVNCTGSTSSDYIELSITDFAIYANIETPFKYLSLTEELDNPTLDDVLNALVGE